MSAIINSILVNRFRVDQYIGSGGMSAVYKVWDFQRNTPLAMKVLHQDLQDDPSILKRFRREARALQKLAHPNIVKFYGLYETPDFLFLIEEYIQGPTLKQILKRQQGKPLSLEHALVVLKALSAALGYAHSQGIIHCDVKPGNVMISRTGEVYLTDFGIARHADSTTTTLATIGTAAYMSPEQIRGEAVSPQTDIYSSGIMLYELLTGRRPFSSGEEGSSHSGGTANERIRHAHLSQQPVTPHLIATGLNPQLSNAILRALEKSAARRYQSMREFFETVARSVGVYPAQVPDRLPSDLFSRFYTEPEATAVDPGYSSGTVSYSKNKKNALVFTGAAFGLIVVCLLSLSLLDLPQSESPAQNVVLAQENDQATHLALQLEQTRQALQRSQSEMQATMAAQTQTAQKNAWADILTQTAWAEAQAEVFEPEPVIIVITNTPLPTATRAPPTPTPRLPTNTPLPSPTATRAPSSTDLLQLYYPLDNCAASHLKNGQWAYVSFSGGANAIRSDPDTNPSDNIIGKAYGGDILQIIGGPECNYGWILWEVEAYTDSGILIGWTPETPDGEDFWLLPCASRSQCPP